MDPQAVSAHKQSIVDEIERIENVIAAPPHRLKCWLSKKPMLDRIKTLYPCLCSYDEKALVEHKRQKNVVNLTKCPQCGNTVEGEVYNTKMEDLVEQWQSSLVKIGIVWCAVQKPPIEPVSSEPIQIQAHPQALQMVQQNALKAPQPTQENPPKPQAPVPVPQIPSVPKLVPLAVPAKPAPATLKAESHPREDSEDSQPGKKKSRKAPVEDIQEVAQAGRDLNELHQAIRANGNRVTIVINKLVKDQSHLILEKDEVGNNCLMALIQHRQMALKIATMMIQNCEELDLNERNKAGKTALHIAVEKHNPDVIRLLVGRGANQDLKDDEGKTPIEYAIGGKCRSAFTVGALNKSNSSVKLSGGSSNDDEEKSSSPEIESSGDEKP